MNFIPLLNVELPTEKAERKCKQTGLPDLPIKSFIEIAK
jgi:hypothetical protein